MTTTLSGEAARYSVHYRLGTSQSEMFPQDIHGTRHTLRLERISNVLGLLNVCIATLLGTL